MQLEDWRQAPLDQLAPWYESERRRWIRDLRWDPAEAWREVEHARASWGLPGLVALDAGRAVRGFTFFLIEDDRLDIGGLVSSDRTATGLLLDGLLAACDGAGATSVRGVLLDDGDGLAAGLAERGFAVVPHHYLVRPLGTRGPARQGGDGFGPSLEISRWQEGDIEPVAALLRESYAREEGALFAPRNGLDEWTRYVANLVTYAGCGVLNRDVSVVVRDPSGVAAAAIVTDIAPGVGHLVQLAVAPRLRGGGAGRHLVEHVSACLARRHYAALTLIVSSSNGAARRIYGTSGFEPAAGFLAATRARSGA